MIKEPLAYKFIYNTCCGGFDVLNKKGNPLIGSVIYRLNKKSKKLYLGTLGEAGIIAKAKNQIALSPTCRSAMSPNIYSISFGEIEICQDSTKCEDFTCLYDTDKNEVIYDVGYQSISTKLKMLYMPLSAKPMQIEYDHEIDSIAIR